MSLSIMEQKSGISFADRTQQLKRHAAEKYNIKEENVHIGHMVLQAMLDNPTYISQIDAATDVKETNKSVAKRACRLASAMGHCGLKPGDQVIFMGNNQLDLSIPFYACHFEGYSVCAIDPSVPQNDLIQLFACTYPKIVFCQKFCEEKVKKALKVNRELAEIVMYDDKNANIEEFVKKYNGTQVYYRPAEFDTSKTIAWLILTSGTSGLAKVAIIPYDTLLNAIISWWTPFPLVFESYLAMATLQWVSSLIFYISGPLLGSTRLQSSAQLTPHSLIHIINTYRPSVTAWTPYLLGQFLEVAQNACDLSCFKAIAIAGSAIEKPLLDKFKKKCGAFLYLIYGMTELLAPIFDFDEKTPFGSTGKPKSQYKFRLIDINGNTLTGTSQSGELWVKGDFFKGYLKNPEETKKMLTDDGWLKTGDIFYKDKQNYYFFVERKRLIIKHYGFMISPLQMEEIIKRHPSVADACVVGLPDPHCLERPIIAVLRRNGDVIEAREIFDLLKKNMEEKRLDVALFFVDSFPVTPSGKVHRARVKEMASTVQLTYS